MNPVRTTLAAAALLLGLTTTQSQVSARPLDEAHRRIAAAWAPGTIPANGPASAAPSLDEWSSAREVDVTKSTAYHCETKVVREWFRSTCVTYEKWTLLSPVCKQANGDECLTFVDPSGRGQKASVVQRLRRGQTYKIRFVWNPGAVGYDLQIAVDGAGGAVAGF
jgi:hypothetical protein